MNNRIIILPQLSNSYVGIQQESQIYLEENVFKKAGWKLVIGTPKSGKSELLKAVCHRVIWKDMIHQNICANVSPDESYATNLIPPQVDAIWVDLQGAQSIDKTASILAHTLKLKGGGITDVFFSFRRFLVSLQTGTVIILDHADNTALAYVASVLDPFRDSLSIVLICRDTSFLEASGLQYQVSFTQTTLNRADSVALVTKILSAKVDKTQIPESLINWLLQVSGRLIGPLSSMCQCLLLSPDLQSVSLGTEDSLLLDCLTAVDILLLSCLHPLIETSPLRFPITLLWHLCRDIFQSEGVSEGQWQDSKERLITIGWLRAEEDDDLSIPSAKLPTIDRPKTGGRWAKYFLFWSTELNEMALSIVVSPPLEAAYDENSDDKYLNSFTSNSEDISATPLTRFNAVNWDSAQMALARFDRYRHHIDSLLTFLEDESPSEAGSETRLQIAAELAGRVGIFLLARVSGPRASVVGNVCHISLQDQLRRVAGLSASDKARRLEACIDLGLLMSRLGYESAAVTLFREGQALTLQDGIEDPLCSPWLQACVHLCLGSNLIGEGSGGEAEVRSELTLALETYRRTAGEHPDMLDCLLELGAHFGSVSRYDEATELLVEAQTLCTRWFGRQHIALAHTKRALARLLQLQDRYAEAAPLLEHALQTCQDLYGAGHSMRADILCELALCKRNAGRCVRPCTESGFSTCLHRLAGTSARFDASRRH